MFLRISHHVVDKQSCIMHFCFENGKKRRLKVTFGGTQYQKNFQKLIIVSRHFWYKIWKNVVVTERLYVGIK